MQNVGSKESYHFKSPHSSNPHLQSTFNTFDVIKLNTFPPTSSCRFSPKEKQLLRHADGIVIVYVAFDIGP